jgi:hypothetical protein
MSQTGDVEVYVRWEGIHQEEERVFNIRIARPASIEHPTPEETMSLETKFEKMIPIPRQYWLKLTFHCPSQSWSHTIYDRKEKDSNTTDRQSLRNFKNPMWRLADEHPTDEPLMTLVLTIEPEAVLDWLDSTPVDRKINLQLPKIIRDNQIKKLLEILDPVHAVLQLPDAADAEDEEDDARVQDIQACYRRAVARLTGAEAPADVGPSQAVWTSLEKTLQHLIDENEAFWNAEPTPQKDCHPWTSLLSVRLQELMQCVQEFIRMSRDYRNNRMHDSMKIRRQIEIRFRDCKTFLAQSYVSLLLHTFDVPEKEPETREEDRFRHEVTHQFMIETFCPHEGYWNLQPDYKDNDRRIHYQQQKTYINFLADCAVFMLIQADFGAVNLSWTDVDNRFENFIEAYGSLLEDRTQEEELTERKMLDLALLYSRKRPPESRDPATAPPGKKRSDMTVLLAKLRACMQ